MVSETTYQALVACGFSEKEVLLYTTGLKLGPSSAHTLAQKTSFNRSSVYDMLRSFSKRGLVSSSNTQATTQYIMSSPQKIMSDLKHKESLLKGSLDELNSINQYSLQPTISTIHTGKQGVRHIFALSLDHEHIDIISTTKIFDVFEYYYPHYVEERTKKNIFARVLQEDSKRARDEEKKDSKSNRVTKIIPGLKLTSSVFIFGEYVAFIKLHHADVTATLIKDKVIARDQKKLFEILWNSIKE